MSKKNLSANKSPRETLEYPMRLDLALLKQRMAFSRTKGEDLVRSGLVKVDGQTILKPGTTITKQSKITLKSNYQYVSRAADKLASVTKTLKISFERKVVLDAGSSTGGFTEYALRHGAKKVIAVDVGTDQLHPKLRGNLKIELHEKTDIRDVSLESRVVSPEKKLIFIPSPDIILIDVSFVSLRYILPNVSKLMTRDTRLIAMFKPQFEAGKSQVNKGVIKNSSIRRQILKDFETWLKNNGFLVLGKADSQVAGAKGNVERFYKLKRL